MTEEFPTREQAIQAAAAVQREAVFDSDVAGLRAASRDEPVLVRTLAGVPSYWLVRLRIENRPRGFVRVTSNGSVGAFGRYGGSNASWVDATEAAEIAARLLSDDETAADPIFVHDGPPGREAWLVATRVGDVSARWLFVTPGGVYQRSAGQLLDADLE